MRARALDTLLPYAFEREYRQLMYQVQSERERAVGGGPSCCTEGRFVRLKNHK